MQTELTRRRSRRAGRPLLRYFELSTDAFAMGLRYTGELKGGYPLWLAPTALGVAILGHNFLKVVFFLSQALMLVDPMDNCGQTGSPVSFSVDGRQAQKATPPTDP